MDRYNVQLNSAQFTVQNYQNCQFIFSDDVLLYTLKDDMQKMEVDLYSNEKVTTEIHVQEETGVDFHIDAFEYSGRQYWIFGSQNNNIIVESEADFPVYSDKAVVDIAAEFFDNVDDESQKSTLEFLVSRGVTLHGKYCKPNRGIYYPGVELIFTHFTNCNPNSIMYCSPDRAQKLLRRLLRLRCSNTIAEYPSGASPLTVDSLDLKGVVVYHVTNQGRCVRITKLENERYHFWKMALPEIEKYMNTKSLRRRLSACRSDLVQEAVELNAWYAKYYADSVVHNWAWIQSYFGSISPAIKTETLEQFDEQSAQIQLVVSDKIDIPLIRNKIPVVHYGFDYFSDMARDTSLNPDASIVAFVIPHDGMENLLNIINIGTVIAVNIDTDDTEVYSLKIDESNDDASKNRIIRNFLFENFQKIFSN